MDNHAIRDEICRFAKKAYDRGIVCGSGGNISARVEDGIIITPKGYSLSDLRPEDLVKVRFDGSYAGSVAPSKETGLHLAAYETVPAGRSIIHVHSYYSIVAGIRIAADGGKPMPAYTASYAVKVGDPQLCGFYPAGTQELKDAVCEGLKKSDIVLMQNHGVIVVSDCLQSAFNLAEEVEMNARLFFDLNGSGALSGAQVAYTLEKVKNV